MILFTLLILIFNNNSQKSFELIQQGQVQKSRVIFLKLKKENSDYFKFVSSYFSRDSRVAIINYDDLFKSSSNKRIKRASQQKLYEYYYANGLYQKAEQFKVNSKSDLNHKKNKKSDYFTIQVGVFSAESNALALKQKINKIVKNKIHLKRENRDGDNIVVVEVGHYSNRNLAMDDLNLMRDKLGLSGWVKKVTKE